MGSKVHLNTPLCPQVTLLTAYLQTLGVFYSSGEVLSSRPEEWMGPALLASLLGALQTSLTPIARVWGCFLLLSIIYTHCLLCEGKVTRFARPIIV